MTTDNGKENLVTCVMCGHRQHYSDFEEITSTGWIPSYYEQDDECEGPVCPRCVTRHLQVSKDGEYEAKQSWFDELDKRQQRKAEENVIPLMRRWHGMH